MDKILHTILTEEFAHMGRLRGLAMEPSLFAVFFSVGFPWMFYSAWTIRGATRIFYIVGVTLCAIMMYLTYSRIGYVVVLAQSLVFAVFLIAVWINKYQVSIKYVRRRWIFLFCGGALLGITILLWRETAIRTVLYSLMDLTFPNNTVRYGSWQAGLNMAWAHPIVGVGIGQYGFYFSQYLPNWAMQIFGFSRFLDPLDYSTWVPAFSIHTRIFAETGIVGGILWLSIWFSTSTVLVLHMFSNNDGATGTRMVQAATLLASLVGLFISGFNNDSFRFLELSVTLAACWIFFRDCNNGVNLLFKNVWSCLCQK